MRLPNVPLQYQPNTERERNRSLELEDKKNQKRDADLDLGGNKLILTSPDGTRYNVTVDNAGNLSTAAL